MTRYALLLLLATDAAAQVYPANPRSAAMAGAAVAVPFGSLADANPATGAGETRALLALRAAQLYELPELRFAEAFLSAPALGGNAALSVSSFGFEDYRELLVAFGYARPIRAGTVRPVLAGVRLRWYRLSISGYGSASVPSLSAGILFPVLERLSLGMAATNLYVPAGSLSPAMERAISVGAALRAAPNLLLAVDAWKAATSPADLRFGFELQAISTVALRGGFSVEPRRYSAGAGFGLAPWFADLAAERHEALGWSPSVAVGFQW